MNLPNPTLVGQEICVGLRRIPGYRGSDYAGSTVYTIIM